MSVSSGARELSLVVVDEADKPAKKRLPLLDQMLREQQSLTAVERFSEVHDGLLGSRAEAALGGPLQEKYYRHLIPVTTPQTGEQYSFQVDLDSCTGCKACVTACHRLNGLDAGETWRSVGLLHGGTPEVPMQKTVTTTCHHCLEPACMQGCPVQAYEKDAVTGIVKHLDDQCIGCQYCIFTCPYEVPQFNAQKGIVRKCDMCSDRLAVGEAPACVQACPNEAISIQIVSAARVIEDAQGDAFLPGVPSPGITLPTTTYKTREPLPRNLLPADFYAVRPAHQHFPLVLMLVFTQLSVGAFTVLQAVGSFLHEAALTSLRPVHGLVALVLAIVALGASTLHLGRPLYAWRAVLGVRTSWLSREILVFGLFAKLAAVYAGALWLSRSAPLPWDPSLCERVGSFAAALGPWVAVSGLVGVVCSTMLYHVTRRRWWAGARTGFKFLMTTAVLGVATTLTTAFASAVWTGSVLDAQFAAFGRMVAWALAVLTLIKLLGEASVLRHLADKQHGDLKRTARLLVGELRRPMMVRGVVGGLGGILLPLAFLTALDADDAVFATLLSSVALLMLVVGEVLERMSFFAALSAPRMPGGLR